MSRFSDASKARKQLAFLILGNKCKKCNNTENLQVDHKDTNNRNPLTKHIYQKGSKQIWNLNEEDFNEELSKCQLLCRDCHKEKTRDETIKPQHGTYSMYTHYKCRCRPCKNASAAYARSFRHDEKDDFIR